MFEEYVYGNSPAAYANLIWINDTDCLNRPTAYMKAFAAHGFDVVEYKDDLSFRIEYEQKLNAGEKKLAVLNSGKNYIPYDILNRFAVYTASLHKLFPRLNADALRHKSSMDLDLLTMVISKNFDNLTNDWYRVAEEKAQIDRYSVQYGLDINTSEINDIFQSYVLKAFGTLSSKIDRDTPVLVSHAMEYMHEQSSKFAIIVMDGMSEFDWNIISQSFSDIAYEQTAAFAMIPSTTSISRQCLLSNKFPSQLITPWVQSKEKAEFTECAKALGYADSQIGYARGYDTDFSSSVRCGAVIINDVDDMVHAQPQGRLGMYNDISVLSDEGKLRQLTERLLSKGFDVYITADHGNALCTGIGRFVGAGVDVETKSHRMVVLKDFADKAKMADKFGLIEYPKYYLPKEYDYLICNTDTSLDNPGEQVMTHGGMTIDEVVVPFIKIKAVQNNG